MEQFVIIPRHGTPKINHGVQTWLYSVNHLWSLAQLTYRIIIGVSNCLLLARFLHMNERNKSKNIRNIPERKKRKVTLVLCQSAHQVKLYRGKVQSFTRASSSCEERKRDLQNEKFFLPTAGLELTTLGFWGHRLNRWAIHTGHTVDVLKLNQVFPLLFWSSSEHVAECFVVYSVLYSYNICIIFRFDQYL